MRLECDYELPARQRLVELSAVTLCRQCDYSTCTARPLAERRTHALRVFPWSAHRRPSTDDAQLRESFRTTLNARERSLSWAELQRKPQRRTNPEAHSLATYPQGIHSSCRTHQSLTAGSARGVDHSPSLRRKSQPVRLRSPRGSSADTSDRVGRRPDMGWGRHRDGGPYRRNPGVQKARSTT